MRVELMDGPADGHAYDVPNPLPPDLKVSVGKPQRAVRLEEGTSPSPITAGGLRVAVYRLEWLRYPDGRYPGEPVYVYAYTATP